MKNPTPDAAVIRSHIYKKIHQKVAISIPDDDLASRYDSHFGLVGYLFPYRVYPGKILKAYADVYLSKLFDSINFNQQADDDLLISLKIINFDISAVSKAAQLEVSLNIENKTNQLLFEKNYRAEGEGHFPLYLGEMQQIAHVSETTNQVFTQVFNEIVKDIQNDSRLGGPIQSAQGTILTP